MSDQKLPMAVVRRRFIDEIIKWLRQEGIPAKDFRNRERRYEIFNKLSLTLLESTVGKCIYSTKDKQVLELAGEVSNRVSKFIGERYNGRGDQGIVTWTAEERYLYSCILGRLLEKYVLPHAQDTFFAERHKLDSEIKSA